MFISLRNDRQTKTSDERKGDTTQPNWHVLCTNETGKKMCLLLSPTKRNPSSQVRQPNEQATKQSSGGSETAGTRASRLKKGAGDHVFVCDGCQGQEVEAE